MSPAALGIASPCRRLRRTRRWRQLVVTAALLCCCWSLRAHAFRPARVSGFSTRTSRPTISGGLAFYRSTRTTAPRRLLKSDSLAYRCFWTPLSASDDWSNFAALDDDDDDAFAHGPSGVDLTEYAVENDSPERKGEVGSTVAAPTVDDQSELRGQVDPIFVPAGSALELSEETVLGILAACRAELGTLFGYTAENRGVGITGGVDYVDMEGPTVVVRLKGRFWHERTTVLARVANYLQQRIPEIIEVMVEDPFQLSEEANPL